MTDTAEDIEQTFTAETWHYNGQLIAITTQVSHDHGPETWSIQDTVKALKAGARVAAHFGAQMKKIKPCWVVIATGPDGGETIDLAEEGKARGLSLDMLYQVQCDPVLLKYGEYVEAGSGNARGPWASIYQEEWNRLSGESGHNSDTFMHGMTLGGEHPERDPLEVAREEWLAGQH